MAHAPPFPQRLFNSEVAVTRIKPIDNSKVKQEITKIMSIKKLVFSLVFASAILLGTTAFHENFQNKSMLRQHVNHTYNLSKPTAIHELSSELLEVSGLTDVSETKIACVQDEKGIIFTYDLLTKEIEEKITFGADADYEGLTRVDDVLYTLSSDGMLFETKSIWKKPVTKSYDLNLPSPDNEGLCYDEKNKRLLIAPKSKIGKGPEFKDSRAIFVFDLKKKELEKEPLFYFSIEEIYAFADSKGIEKDSTFKKNGQLNKNQNFRPASIAVHPKTGDIYVISAEDFNMVVFSESGEIKDYFSLDKSIFPKPEGITFLNDGTMIITNEGVEGNATLVVIQ